MRVSATRTDPHLLSARSRDVLLLLPGTRHVFDATSGPLGCRPKLAIAPPHAMTWETSEDS